MYPQGSGRAEHTVMPQHFGVASDGDHSSLTRLGLPHGQHAHLAGVGRRHVSAAQRPLQAQRHGLSLLPGCW